MILNYKRIIYETKLKLYMNILLIKKLEKNICKNFI